MKEEKMVNGLVGAESSGIDQENWLAGPLAFALTRPPGTP
jgi:hypothetical protein